MEKPRQSLAGLISISFGFLGIQFAFGLQNANVSRIFQSLGSSVDDLPFLWLAGPVTGLLVQPLIGHFSDHHWSRFGRRRPFFFAGAVLAALALFGFPHAGSLFAGAVFLWLLDASLNISMEPFRAFVGDMTRSDQRASGYAVQTVLIGTGAVLGSLAPAAFTALGVSNSAPEGLIPDSVRYALYLGGAAIFSAVLWTVMRVKEYSPQEMAAFNPQNDNGGDDENDATAANATTTASVTLAPASRRSSAAAAASTKCSVSPAVFATPAPSSAFRKLRAAATPAPLVQQQQQRASANSSPEAKSDDA